MLWRRIVPDAIPLERARHGARRHGSLRRVVDIGCRAAGALRRGRRAVDGAQEDGAVRELRGCAVREGGDAGRGDVGEGAGDVVVELQEGRLGKHRGARSVVIVEGEPDFGLPSAKCELGLGFWCGLTACRDGGGGSVEECGVNPGTVHSRGSFRRVWRTRLE
jgi:hypothetical protein